MENDVRIPRGCLAARVVRVGHDIHSKYFPRFLAWLSLLVVFIKVTRFQNPFAEVVRPAFHNEPSPFHFPDQRNNGGFSLEHQGFGEGVRPDIRNFSDGAAPFFEDRYPDLTIEIVVFLHQPSALTHLLFANCRIVDLPAPGYVRIVPNLDEILEAGRLDAIVKAPRRSLALSQPGVHIGIQVDRGPRDRGNLPEQAS